VTTPFELINTRIIADASKPKEFRWGYTSVNDGYSKLAKMGSKSLF